MVAKRRRRHLYILEWMKARGLSDEQLALKVGTTRVTIWRWANEQHRLNPEKIERLATALDLEPPELWRPPSRRSIDAILANAPDEVNDMAADVVERMVRQRRP